MTDATNGTGADRASSPEPAAVAATSADTTPGSPTPRAAPGGATAVQDREPVMRADNVVAGYQIGRAHV